MKILVTGATGKLGAGVVEHLLGKMQATDIAVLVRDPAKAADLEEKGVRVHAGDYDDLQSLEKAMAGMDKVLLIAGTDEERRLQQHSNVIDSAKKAGVPFVAYTSRCLSDPATLVNKLMKGHFQTEAYLQESGLRYTIFRNILYMDTIPNFVGEHVFETGIALPLEQGSVAFALRQEMAEAIANSLFEDSAENAVYRLTGAALYTFRDVAEALTLLSGKTVGYTALDAKAFKQRLEQKGLPAVVIGRITGFLSDIANGQESDVTPDLERLLGRTPATLTEGLKRLYGL